MQNWNTYDVAKACSYRDGKVKKCQDAWPRIFGEKIRDNGWSNGGVGSFSNANQGSEEQKCPKILHEGADECGQSPQRKAKNHDPLAAESVAHVAEKWCKKHVTDDKGCLQQTQVFVVGNVEKRVSFDVVHHPGDGGPIHVIDEIDKTQDQDSSGICLV